MKALLLFAIGLLSLEQPTFAQAASTSFGPSLTLSDGQCAEVIPADTLRRIGRHAYSTVTGKAYRFGFQGQEKDDEIYGATGTSYAFEYRMHDPRVGRFWSIDPLAGQFPHNSPYAFSENRVLDRIEFEGLEAWPTDPNAGPVTQADYQQFALSKSLELTSDADIKAEFQDCADACMLIPVLYHQERGLPFTMDIGGKHLDSNAPKYQGDGAFSDFMEDVRLSVSADQLRNPAVSKPIASAVAEPGDLMNSGGHANTFLGRNGPADEPVQAMNASGMYFGKGSLENEEGTGPKMETYSGAWAQTYRFNFVANAERGSPIERMDIRQTSVQRDAPERKPIGRE